jgi:hypothetical protein
VRWGVMGWIFWLRIGTGAEFCECGNEPSGSIKCRNFLTSWVPFSFSGKTLLQGVRYS